MTDEELEEKIADLAPKVEAEQKSLGPNDDMWGSPNAQELLRLERARSSRKLNKIHPGNRFRLMFGQPMLPEPGKDIHASYNPKITTNTNDGTINQEFSVLGTIHRYILNTREKQVREALIKLGWTPLQS